MTYAKIRGTITVPGSPTQFMQADLTAEEVGLDEDIIPTLVGDGLARVAVSMDLADRNFGTGWSAHVTVTLTSGQSEDSLRATHGIATALTEEFVGEAFAVAKNLARAHLTPQRD